MIVIKMISTAAFNPIKQKVQPLVKRFLQPSTIVKVASKAPSIINCSVVEKLCNQVFDEQIQDGEFDFLNKRLLQINITDAELYFVLTFQQNRIKCQYFGLAENESDVTLRINTSDGIALVQQNVDPDTLFFQRRLKINGDTELAHHIKNTIDTLDPEKIPPVVLMLLKEYKEGVL